VWGQEDVDTFPLDSEERLRPLEEWGAHYETGIECASLHEAPRRGVPAHLAGFTRVVRGRDIPPEHYRAFPGAMRLDIRPRPFRTLDDLIRSYVYGSAVVVGYFLTHIYGTHSHGWRRAFLRPPNRHPRVRGLYHVGGSSHPGGGTPTVLLSAKITSELIGRHER
jgi:phytoene dehydrogenase-like protein